MRRKDRRRRYRTEPLEVRALLTGFDLKPAAFLLPEHGPETLHSDFGWDVAVDGLTAVVGAPNATAGSDTLVRSGAGYVYEFRDNGTPQGSDDFWQLMATLSPAHPSLDDQFGTQVAISGDTIVVARPRVQIDSLQFPSVFVFQKPETGWSGDIHESAELRSSRWGHLVSTGGVAVSGNTISLLSNTSAYIEELNPKQLQYVGLMFERPLRGWNGLQTESAVLRVKHAGESYFGPSVALDGGTAIISAAMTPATATQTGADPESVVLFVYQRPQAGWTGILDHSALLAVRGQFNQTFGNGRQGWSVSEVALRGRTVVVLLAAFDVPGVTHRPVAAVFEASNEGWRDVENATSILTASNLRFGTSSVLSVATDGTTVILTGMEYDESNGDLTGTRVANVYARPAGGWASVQREIATFASDQDPDTPPMRTSVAIGTGQVLIGTSAAWQSGLPSGSVSAYAIAANGASEHEGSAVLPYWTSGPQDFGRLTERVAANMASTVAIDGDTAVVFIAGSANVQKQQFGPALWIYRNAGANWQRVAELFVPRDVDGYLIDVIKLLGTTIVVGFKSESHGDGFLVFERPANGWSDSVNPVARLGLGNGVFRYRPQIAFDGKTLVAAVHEGQTRTTALFECPATGWKSVDAPQARLTTSSSEFSSHIEDSIAMDGSTIVVARTQIGTSLRSDRTFVFERPSSGWNGRLTESAVLVSASTEEFFHSRPLVAIRGRMVIVGGEAVYDSASNTDDQGLQVFIRPQSGWHGQHEPVSRLLIPHTDGVFSCSALETLTIFQNRVFVLTRRVDHDGSGRSAHSAFVNIFDLTTVSEADVAPTDLVPVPAILQPNAWYSEDLTLSISEDFWIFGSQHYSQSARNTGAALIVTLVPNPDLGDAPDSYVTTMLAGANGGPRHKTIGPKLGLLRDGEPDAQVPLDGLSDDSAKPGEVDDDDGVTIGKLAPGVRSHVRVVVSEGAGILSGWIDFNRDGDFLDAGEKILNSQQVFTGTQTVSFDVPADAGIGGSFARFRISTATGLAVDGPAPDGEVEDYAVEILNLVPVILQPQAIVPSGYPLLEWTAISDSLYEIWLTNRSTNIVLYRERLLHASRWTPELELPIGSYTLWVRSVSSNGIRSRWSLPRSFQVATAPILGQPPEPHDRTPTISWRTLPGANSWDVWISSLSTLEVTLIQQQLPRTTTSFTPLTTLVAGKYRYWVRAKDQSGLAASWSSPGEFEIGIETRPVPKRSFNRRPQLSWNAESSATSYEVYLANTSTGVVMQVGRLTGTSWSPPSDLALGDYRFFVRGVVRHTANLLPWSKPLEFNTSGQTRVLSPVNTIRTVRPLISWEAVEGASEYKIHIQHLGSALVTLHRQTNSTTFQTASPLAPGDYRIWIQAVTPNGTRGNWSASADFSIRLSRLSPRFLDLGVAILGKGEKRQVLKFRDEELSASSSIQVADSVQAVTPQDQCHESRIDRDYLDAYPDTATSAIQGKGSENNWLNAEHTLYLALAELLDGFDG